MFQFLKRFILLSALLLSIDHLEGASLQNENKDCSIFSELKTEVADEFYNCVTELNLSDKVPGMSASKEQFSKYYKNIEAKDFDDKCLIKCVFDKLKIFKGNADEFVDLRNIEAIYQKDKLPQSAMKDLLTIWKTCNVKIEQQMPGGGNKENICKKSAAYDNCLHQELLKMTGTLC